ncbi:mechanosensitive ion channel [Luminiphilus sp.]|nr:mechanosensitive ion channel [Luminiphilus sp.]MDA9579750.1 mechanosensitive ion channel [Luminiphilus sp.]MDB2351627.1 mechanosensitive ion channel [Luminiphilus sp.]
MIGTMMELGHYTPAITTLVLGSISLLILSRLTQRASNIDAPSLVLQLIFWGAGLAVVVALVVALPLEAGVRGQILSLIGVVLTAIIALSSTTFVSNAMAGIMLQATRPFKPGDFILVNGVFGRVTRRSLVSTRIQTETRDFTNLPNLLLVTQPVTVQHREGTIIQADVSLGYDVHHSLAKRELLKAAENAGLADPYVLVAELLDHAVVYRAAGFLEDVVNPLTARSQLRQKMLDALHGAGIEIASPNIVAQRQQSGDTQTLPEEVVSRPTRSPAQKPDTKIFDSAHAAANTEALREQIRELKTEIDAQQEKIKAASDETRASETLALESLERQLKWLESEEANLTK